MNGYRHMRVWRTFFIAILHLLNSDPVFLPGTVCWAFAGTRRTALALEHSQLAATVSTTLGSRTGVIANIPWIGRGADGRFVSGSVRLRKE